MVSRGANGAARAADAGVSPGRPSSGPCPQPLAPSPLVIFNRVSAGYGRQTVVHDISLGLAAGQFAGIVGPSGSGKTTLLRAMLGLASIQAGRVTVDGEPVDGQAPAGVGYVPQLETVDWSFPVTAEQVVLMGRRAGGGWPWPSREDRRAVAA